MGSYRATFSFHPVRDHEIIEWLVALQEEGKASDEVRDALYEHMGIQVTLQNIMDKLEQIERRLDNMTVVQAEPRKQEILSDANELDQRLGKTLGRFRK